MLLNFCGAAETVTGSCYWLQNESNQFLVDCGMFQGSKALKGLNYENFPFDPKKIDFVLLTHAHIDHSGLLPKLVKQGFNGPIFTTEGTFDLLTYMLPDSGHIHEMEVEWLNRRNAQRGKPSVDPIYTKADAGACLKNFSVVEYEDWRDVGEGVRARFWNAGHILGAASIEVEITSPKGKRGQATKRLLFSGDIGPDHKLFHPDPDAPNNWDFICCEGTYGGRTRTEATPDARRTALGREVNEALARGGNLLIPSFAVERTQELLLDLAHLFDDGTLPTVPVFLDSPLAIKATEVFAKNAHDLEDTDGHGNPFRRSNIRFTGTAEESKTIARVKGGAIIMAGSGMCEAGRIRHHLKQNLWRTDATVLLVGYQAPGTLGAVLASGAKAVKIQGEDVRVGAAIRQIDLYSGHADGEQLVRWVKARLPVKSAIFLTHGEEEGLRALAKDIAELGVDEANIIIPKLDDAIDLSSGRATGKSKVRFRRKDRRLESKAVREPDWHNDLAELSLELRRQLDDAADDRSRKKILRRISRALSPR
ncbi:MAG: MBL fold metallo-hydrolase [Parvibaculum sp.]